MKKWHKALIIGGIFVCISIFFGYSDIDQDGLVNKDELFNGTDALNPDTDDDGLTDGYEIREYGTSPTNKDTDNDGLNDKEEWAYDYCSPFYSI